MGLQMSEKETLYQRRQMFDNMKTHGIKATIYSIQDKYIDAYDFYNDIINKDMSYDDKIETYLTYEEVPQIKTLKSLGWYVETQEFPVIAYIPVLYMTQEGEPAAFKPKVDDLVTLVANPIDGDDASTREFLIKDFKGNGFPNVIYYTVKMVPYRSNDTEYQPPIRTEDIYRTPDEEDMPPLVSEEDDFYG